MRNEDKPLTEEIRLRMFGSPDLSVFLRDLVSDKDPVYSRENLFENLGTPEKMCLICTGTPVKTCWKFGSRNYFQSDLLRPVGGTGLECFLYYQRMLTYLAQCQELLDLCAQLGQTLAGSVRCTTKL